MDNIIGWQNKEYVISHQFTTFHAITHCVLRHLPITEAHSGKKIFNTQSSAT